MRRDFNSVCLTVLGLAVALSAAEIAVARPPHKRTLKNYYGERLSQSLESCTTCHLSREQSNDPDFDEEAPPHNVFGIRLRELGEAWQAEGKPLDLLPRLKLVADEDADGDGVANEIEILAGHAPGNKDDTPTQAEVVLAVKARSELRAQRDSYQWAPFQPVTRPVVPHVADGWARNPIDAFILAKRAERGLNPRPEASPEVLLRRVYLDLIGLPPTAAQRSVYLADPSIDAYEKVVDRLLASPQYGERWGRHWMDVWRYSDWAGWGQQVRDSQPHIWRWRDWIIESLNGDKAYDRMIVEQLAGDELAPGDSDALRATGYLVRNYKRLSREQWMQDTVEHTAKAFLGLTLNCARCHNHMYDPISQAEYYQVRAVFEPYEVRLDRLPGESNVEKQGLPRVFDAKLDAPTYLFVRGDERKFDKEKPLLPAAPKLLGHARLNVQPTALPPQAYYPGLQPFVQRESLDQADAQVSAAESALAEARQSPGGPPESAEAKSDQHKERQLARMIAEKALAAAQSARDDLRARIDADLAKYAKPVDSRAGELAAAAARAERHTAVCKAEEALLRAQRRSTEARMKAEAVKLASPAEAAAPDDAAAKAAAKAAEEAQQALAAADKELTAAQQAFDKARAAQREPSAEYSPLTPVYPQTSSGRRLAFARWIADRNNPLTGRVAVNHIWLRHFGQALVPSVFDFGQNGQPPVHPELLDWLAAELMEQGWSMKALHRLMVTSSTYRMSSSGDEPSGKIDPDNRYFWRMPERRMEAEVVRDSLLNVAGELDSAMGGPDIDHELGQSIKRRTLYFRHAAEKEMTFVGLFDPPPVNECYERRESIAPQQALALANSQLSLVQARLLARALNAQRVEECSFIAGAFERVLSRAASTAEIDVCQSFLTAQAALLSKALESGKPTSEASDAADGSKPAADPVLRAREDLVHALLNHNDFVTIH